MKKLITLLLFFSICVFSINAEELLEQPQDTIIKTVSTTEVKDPITGQTTTTTTEIEKRVVEKKEPEGSNVMYDGSSYNFIFSWKKKNKRSLDPHWTGIGMGFMNYDSDDIPYGSLKMSTSHNFTLNLIDYHKQLSNNWLIVSGIGTEWSRYHFDENAALTKRDGITYFEPAPDGVDYKSTKLLSYYITIPLLLEYQTSNFHISGGPVAMFKYYSKSQIKYYEDNRKVVLDRGKDLNMRTVDLRLRLQIGFNDIAIYGYYAPFSMFEKNKGPELRTYTIGLMIGV